VIDVQSDRREIGETNETVDWREKIGDDRTMNRLARERSPYLLQHAANPVEWFP